MTIETLVKANELKKQIDEWRAVLESAEMLQQNHKDFGWESKNYNVIIQGKNEHGQIGNSVFVHNDIVSNELILYDYIHKLKAKVGQLEVDFLNL